MANKVNKSVFKALKKITPARRPQIASSPVGKSMLALLTPSEFADLFPKQYEKALPDVAGFREAISKKSQQKQQDILTGLASGGGTTVDQAEKVGRTIREGGTGGGYAGGKGGGVPNVDNMTESEKNFLGLVLKYESGNRNIPNYINDKTHTAQGYFQLTNTNWRNIAPKLGITSPNAMSATKEEQTRVALALLRQTGQGNWTSFNPSLNAAVRRGEVAQYDVPDTGATPSGPGQGTTTTDFSKYALNRGVNNYQGECGVGTRKMAARMFGYDGFDSKGLGGNAHTLSEGNTYFQDSGLFHAGKPVHNGALTQQYLDSLPIGTVVSSSGGNASGQGHVQIKIGPGKWASDTVQSGFLGPDHGYNNFMVHMPNEQGMARLQQHGVQTSYTTPDQQPTVNVKPTQQAAPPTPPTVAPSVAPPPPEIKDDGRNTKSATVNKPAGPKSFDLSRSGLISAVKKTDEFKNTWGSSLASDDQIYNGFLDNPDVQAILAKTKTTVDRQTGRVTSEKPEELMKSFGVDTKGVLIPRSDKRSDVKSNKQTASLSSDEDYLTRMRKRDLANNAQYAMNDTGTMSDASPTVSTKQNKIVEVLEAGKGYTTVKYEDGRVEKRTGHFGWRQNNPGNIVYTGSDWQKELGAMPGGAKKGAPGKFAVFPTPEAGHKAREHLMFESDSYKNLTIDKAIDRYAPRRENPQNPRYKTETAKAAGVHTGYRMGDLNAEQRQAFMETQHRLEGNKVGKIDVLQEGTPSSEIAAAPQSTPPIPTPTPQTPPTIMDRLKSAEQKVAGTVQKTIGISPAEAATKPTATVQAPTPAPAPAPPPQAQPGKPDEASQQNFLRSQGIPGASGGGSFNVGGDVSFYPMDKRDNMAAVDTKTQQPLFTARGGERIDVTPSPKVRGEMGPSNNGLRSEFEALHSKIDNAPPVTAEPPRTSMRQTTSERSQTPNLNDRLVKQNEKGQWLNPTFDRAMNRTRLKETGDNLNGHFSGGNSNY